MYVLQVQKLAQIYVLNFQVKLVRQPAEISQPSKHPFEN